MSPNTPVPRPTAEDYIAEAWEQVPDRSWIAATSRGIVAVAPALDDMLADVRARKIDISTLTITQIVRGIFQ